MRRVVPVACALAVFVVVLYAMRARSQHVEAIKAESPAPAAPAEPRHEAASPARPMEHVQAAKPQAVLPPTPTKVPELPKSIAEAVATRPWLKAKLDKLEPVVVAGIDLKLAVLDKAKNCIAEKVHGRGEVYVRVNLLKQGQKAVEYDVEMEPAHATLSQESVQALTECVEVAAQGYERPLLDFEDNKHEGGLSQHVLRFIFPLERDRAVRLVTDPDFDAKPLPIRNEGEVIEESVEQK